MPLELIVWDRQSGYITCSTQSARDSVWTEKVGEIGRKKTLEALAAEKRQLVMNSLRDRQPLQSFQSMSDMFAFSHA